MFILLLGVLVFYELYPFFPGILGAVTLYILLRQWYFKMTLIYRWKKWLAALVFILGAILVFVLPFFLIGMLLMPKLMPIIQNPSQITSGVSNIVASIQKYFPQLRIDTQHIQGMLQNILQAIPGYFGATMQILSNLMLCLFLLYFLFVSGRTIEKKVQEFMALKPENSNEIWQNTQTMVISNAVGIPLLAVFQAISAILGYLIFGVEGAVVWGVLTGLFSMVPIVGTAVVWVPLVAYQFATGATGTAIGVLLFSVIVTVNIDNVLRFTLLRKLGDVHPVVTVLGIIIGIPLFGFMGLIFGPLLLSYFLLLIKVYQVEFSKNSQHQKQNNIIG
ncbi:MAG: AI-2E family transporter [Bacteroidetes bacterium]|nr:AI-2E family transporter [Bacteroidota bacterium]